MDKLETRNRPDWLPEPLPVLAPRALNMAGSFLLAWNPGAAAPSPFAVGYVCALPRDSSIYAAFGAFLGYLLTGARLGAAFGCALALCMTVQLLTGWEKPLPALGAAASLVCGLLPGEVSLWRLALTCALAGLLGRFLQISRTGSHGHARYSLTGKLCLLCLVLVVLRPLSVVGGLMTVGAGLWLFGERRKPTPRPAPVRPAEKKPAGAAASEPVKQEPLRRVREAVRLLGAAFTAPEPEPDRDLATEAFLKTAETVCGRCEKRQHCWGDRYRATRETIRGLTPVLRRTHRLSPSDLPHGFVTDCLRPEQFCRVTGDHYGSALRRRAREQESVRSRRLMEDQLAGMEKMLGRAAGEQTLPRFLPHLERKVRAVAAAYGQVTALRVFRRDRRLWVELTLEGPMPDLSALERSLVLALGCRFRSPTVTEEGARRLLRFVQSESLALTCTAAQQPRAGEQLCGDSMLQLRCEDGRALVLLSDGMGSGEQACRLSRSALELIAAFLRAGCGLEESCAAVLPALTVRSERSGFVTLDLLEVDLFSGEALLLKYGAARSWLLRENRCEPLGCTTLPAGLEPEGEPGRLAFSLNPGERLLLVSDGVADPEPLLTQSPREAPKELVRRLLARSDDRDDRTVILVQVTAAP